VALHLLTHPFPSGASNLRALQRTAERFASGTAVDNDARTAGTAPAYMCICNHQPRERHKSAGERSSAILCLTLPSLPVRQHVRAHRRDMWLTLDLFQPAGMMLAAVFISLLLIPHTTYVKVCVCVCVCVCIERDETICCSRCRCHRCYEHHTSLSAAGQEHRRKGSVPYVYSAVDD
jgi:hypothetical protein